MRSLPLVFRTPEATSSIAIAEDFDKTIHETPGPLAYSGELLVNLPASR